MGLAEVGHAQGIPKQSAKHALVSATASPEVSVATPVIERAGSWAEASTVRDLMQRDVPSSYGWNLSALSYAHDRSRKLHGAKKVSDLQCSAPAHKRVSELSNRL